MTNETLTGITRMEQQALEANAREWAKTLTVEEIKGSLDGPFCRTFERKALQQELNRRGESQ